MTLTITPVYAAILAIFFVAMSFYVIVTRAKTDVLVGDGGNLDMLVAIRRHGNLAEYMPFAIVMMALGEIVGLGSAWLHVSGLALIAGRLVHPFGVARENSPLVPRVAGVLSTFAAMLIPGVYILYASFT
ncbi:MAG: MAPEG family protein [Silicimonas sp.]|nr:MAPEG family protein [Silicimonas sp.]RZW04216.1 MAG: glutathione metabolism protein [Paracoccaceae bacterium]